MNCYTQEMLSEYLKNDWILDLLEKLEIPEDKEYRTHMWLKEMDNKRMIYADMYGDLLTQKTGLNVLDVGGGYTSLTKKLIDNQNYTLLDFMAHGSNRGYLNKVFSHNNATLLLEDWYPYSGTGYDVIIANDLFPDVDQRLSIFITKFLAHCKELRLSITFYNTPRFYAAKRIDDSEVLTFLSYDGEITALILKKFLGALNATEKELNALKDFKESIYRNGRQICYIRLKGGLG